MGGIQFSMPIPNDEIPYSILARYSLLSAFSPPQVMMQIYGNRRKRLHPYLPSPINDFAHFFGLSTEDVIINRTIYPLFRFSQPLDADDIKNEMLKNTEAKVLLKTAIGHSRFRFFYGLSYCPLCVDDDINNLGFAYWHINHQIPGVQVCFKHHIQLHSLPAGDGRRDRTLVLPPLCNESKEPATPSKIKLADFASDLLSLSKLMALDYRNIYRRLLEDKALICSGSGRLKMRDIVEELKNYWRELPFSDDTAQAGVPSALADFEYIGRILRKKTHASCHPTKHVLLACWLTDGDINNLLKTLATQSLQSPLATIESTEVDRLIISQLQHGVSLNKIEKESCKSRTYIRRLCELNRIKHRSNSSSYSEEVRRNILIKAMYGINRHSIADSAGVSVGYVEQVISNEPNMVRWRKHLKTQKKVMAASETLKQLVSKHPELCKTKLREHAQAEFALLYHHNPVLLNSLMPAPQKPKPYSKNWRQEDERLHAALSDLPDFGNMSITEIDRKINGHGNLLRRKDKLPKTWALLAKIN